MNSWYDSIHTNRNLDMGPLASSISAVFGPNLKRKTPESYLRFTRSRRQHHLAFVLSANVRDALNKMCVYASPPFIAQIESIAQYDSVTINILNLWHANFSLRRMCSAAMFWHIHGCTHCLPSRSNWIYLLLSFFVARGIRHQNNIMILHFVKCNFCVRQRKNWFQYSIRFHIAPGSFRSMHFRNSHTHSLQLQYTHVTRVGLFLFYFLLSGEKTSTQTI